MATATAGRNGVEEQADAEMDPEKFAREELLRLQRQYRNLEMERQEYSIRSGSAAHNQLSRVEYYERARTDILTDLSNITAEKYQLQDRETIATIYRILDNISAHEEEIERQIRLITEMDEQVAKISKRVLLQKLKVQAVFGNSMTPPQAERHLRHLENRLYRITTDFDTQVTVNGKIRQQIEMLLQERGMFHKKYGGIKRRIARMKRAMSELVDVATITYDQREECVTKMRALRDRNDKESRAHVLEMKEFHRLLHNEEKQRVFMDAKTKVRPLIENDDIRFERLHVAKELHYDNILKSYRKNFRDIQAVAQTRDIQILLQNYVSQETKNFAKFQYLSTLNSELDFLERAVMELKGVIDVRAAEHKRTKAEQQKKLQILEQQFEQASIRESERKSQLSESNMDLNKMLGSLQTTFTVAECDKHPIMRLLGDEKAEIVPENVYFCMKLLESRIQELQFENSELQIRKAVEVEDLPLGSIAKGPSAHAAIGRKAMGGFIKPRSTTRLDPGAGEEDDDEASFIMSQRPYTYEELRTELQIKFTQGHVFRLDTSSSINLAAAPSQRSLTTPSQAVIL